MRKRAIGALAAAFLVAGCEGNFLGLAGGLRTGARIRVLNALPTAPSIDVLVDGVVVASNIGYGVTTSYLALDAASSRVQVRPVGSTTSLVDVPFDGAQLGDFTIIASTGLGQFGSIIVSDESTVPPVGQTRLRVLHAAPSVALVDVYVTDPGASLLGATPTLTAVPLGAASSYLTVAAGPRQIRVTVAGSPTLLLADTGTLSLASRSITNVLVLDRPGGGLPVQLVLAN